VNRAAPACALIAALVGGCFHDLDPRVVLGTQGYLPQPALVLPRWSRQVTFNEFWDYKPLEYAVPVASDNGERVYVGSRQGELTGFETRTGKAVWQLKIGRELRSEPVFHEGTLFLGAADGHFYSVDAEEGKVRWKYATKAEIQARPFVTPDRIYFTSADHSVYALDTDTGEWRWHYTRSVPEGFAIGGPGGVLVHKESVYVGFADGYLVSLKAADGALLWEKRLSEAQRFGDVTGTPALGGGAVVAVDFTEGIFALDPEDGIIRWKIPARGASTPAIVGEVGYVTTLDGEVVAFSVADGKIRWRVQVASGYLSMPLVYERHLLVSQSEIAVAQTRGGVWLLDRLNGRVATAIDVGHGVRGSPIVSRGNIFFLTDSGWIHGYRFGRGAP
jgi:outer membrane protein assembly factor BamB